MSAPTDLPRWADVGGDIVEPSSGEKDVGWVDDQLPPAQYFNWWQNLVYLWTSYFKDELNNVLDAAGSTPTDNTGLLTAIHSLQRGSQLANQSRSQLTASADDINALAKSGAGVIVAVGTTGKIYSALRSNVAHANCLDDLTWTARTADASYTDDFLGLFFSGSLFVAVGETGEIQTSPTGTTWTHRSTGGGFSGRLTAVTKHGSLWVAVGQSGEIQTSPDATTWTHRTPGSGYAGTFRSVAYGAGLYVAVGDDGEIQTSPDGTTWTRRTNLAHATDDLSSVVFGAGIFVVCSSYDGASFSRSQISVDGITWTNFTALKPGAGAELAYGDGAFVLTYVDYGQIGHSTNGKDWKYVTGGDPDLSGAERYCLFDTDRWIFGLADMIVGVTERLPVL